MISKKFVNQLRSLERNDSIDFSTIVKDPAVSMSKNLMKKRDLVITSSRKDALSIMGQLWIPAVAFQAESIMPKEHVMQYVNERFDNIFLFYDNDINGKENWGQNAAAKLIAKFPYLLNIKIDEKWNCKDYSDFVFTHGTDVAYQEMRHIIDLTKNEN